MHSKFRGTPRATGHRAVQLLASATIGALAVALVARLPDVFGVTLGEPVPRRSAVTGAVLLGAVAAGVAATRPGSVRGRASVRRALAVAALGTLCALALVGTFDLDVPRRRGVALAGACAVGLAVVQASLAALGGRVATLVVLAAGIAGLVGLRSAGRAPLRTSLPRVDGLEAAPRSMPNLLLVTLDTTRTDALGCYGQERPTTPRIDALATSSTRWTHATAEAPHTHPSMASLLTSRFPNEHGSVSGSPHLSEQVTTLAEHLRARGYATAGFLDNPWLGAEFGLARGYEHLERRVETERVARWLDRAGDGPFLLHVHLFHPHGPYELRAAALEEIGGPRAPLAARRRVGRRVAAGTIRAGEVPGRHGFDADEIEWLRDLYLSEVRAMDAQVGALLDLVDERFGLDRTIVVVAGDHGEEFDERGSLHHSHSLYEELVHVPLLIRPAGGATTARSFDEPVGLVDVAPTVLDLAGLAPLRSAAGRSLVPLLEGRPVEAALSVSQRYEHAGRRTLLAARSGRWKLHLRTPGPRTVDVSLVPAGTPRASEVALFDLAEDPGERRDLAWEQTGVVREMLAALRAWESAARARTPTETRSAAGPDPPLSPAARAELRGLGYGDGR